MLLDVYYVHKLQFKIDNTEHRPHKAHKAENISIKERARYYR